MTACARVSGPPSVHWAAILDRALSRQKWGGVVRGESGFRPAVAAFTAPSRMRGKPLADSTVQSIR